MASTLLAIKQRFGIIGVSEALDNALQTAVRVAPTDLTVLITGQSGVGKEVFSKIIHDLSARKHNQFIAVNCGAIPEGTINSELFGHEKGAFTGASEARKGYFETANGGTIFLDEIGEMPLDTQTHLLRILENGEFMRVGSSKVQKTNVRVIAATNVQLLERVDARRFREDLYYRLSIVPIKVPALRERREDIYLLFRKFSVDFSERYRTQAVQLDEEARIILENYDFPGNIRQLKNIAEQISALATQKNVAAAELMEFLPKSASQSRGLMKTSSTDAPLQEREILYKILFDLKRDMNELKTWVYQLVQDNNLQMPAPIRVTNNPLLPTNTTEHYTEQPHITLQDHHDFTPHHEPKWQYSSPNATPNPNTTNGKPDYDEAVEPDAADFSIGGMERDLIRKALIKHKNRRKDAADELGISERTLYRKIKEYDIKVK